MRPLNRRLTLGFLATLIAGTSCAWDTYPDQPEPKGEVGLETERLPPWLVPYSSPEPNVMLLVDRSQSMTVTECNGGDCVSRWDGVMSLGSYLSEVKESARLGLALFPSNGDRCGAGAAVRVPLSGEEDIDEQIMFEVQTSTPGGSTPTAQALDEVRENGGLTDTDRDNVVVLLTDGMPNCTSCETNECELDEAVAAVERLVADGIKVFVIGFGVRPGTQAETTLTAMAAAAAPAFEVGEVDTAPGYFAASGVQELIARLYTVSLQSQPCAFKLQRAVAPADLVVSFDREEIVSCEGQCDSGYSYDESTGEVEFHGETCAQLRDGAPHELWFGDREYMND